MGVKKKVTPEKKGSNTYRLFGKKRETAQLGFTGVCFLCEWFFFSVFLLLILFFFFFFFFLFFFRVSVRGVDDLRRSRFVIAGVT